MEEIPKVIGIQIGSIMNMRKKLPETALNILENVKILMPEKGNREIVKALRKEKIRLT